MPHWAKGSAGKAESDRSLAELVDGIRVAMLALQHSDRLEAVPLTVQKVDGNEVWFLVGDGADWLNSVDGPAHLSFVDDETWVSASGTASVVNDPAAIEELGDPVSDAWFQEGQSPLALRFLVANGSWWSAPGAVRAAIGLVKAKVTGSEPDIGEHGSVGTDR
ncbi:MAG: pyridoxamine 5'-phosphate oxidase family protein [Aquihabitans sp.]